MAIYKRKFSESKETSLITCGKKKLPYVLSKEQLLRIICVVDDIKMAMVIFIGIFQGLRISEITRLKWSEVDLQNGELKVIDGKNTKRYKSGYGKDRIVPINEMFLPIWKQWRVMNPEQEFVIPPEKNNGKIRPYKTMIRHSQHRFHTYLGKVGLIEIDYMQKDNKPRYKYHIHTLRHVCGTNLYRAGMDLYQIKEFLGHEDSALVIDKVLELTPELVLERGSHDFDRFGQKVHGNTIRLLP